MKNYLKLTREGFTLVELMVVVAIIGILASIAIPQYSKFQAKSRQSEVRIQLGATYTVEESFAAENSTFTQCLGQVGYNRDGTKFYYTIGFGTGGITSCTPGGASGGPCTVYQWQYMTSTTSTAGTYSAAATCASGNGTDYFASNISEPNTPGNTTQGSLSATVLSSTAFTIEGAGNILSKAANTDTWTIDNNKQILNTQSGLN